MSVQIVPQNPRNLNVLIKVSQNIISTLDYEKVLQIISDGMSELLEIETAAIYLLENDNQLVLSATTPPLPPEMPDFLRKANLSDHPHIEKAILTQQSQIVTDTKKEKLTVAELSVVKMRNLKSILYFPFIQEDKVLGVLILGTSNKTRSFSKHEINMGQTVANQLSVAISNSKLHIDLKNHKENLEKLVLERTCDLEAAIEELKTINEELHLKNEINIQQKEEIEATLNNLKAVQTRLIQSEKMASLGVLTAGVAHEINNPLNFIKGGYHGLERLFSDKKELEKIAPLLNAIKTGVERATDIIQGLNQFSRDSKTYNESCDIHTIIDNCLTILNSKFKHRINIEKNFCKNDFIVKGNVGKLHQAFTNILVNAIQAIATTGTISIQTRRNDDEVVILIKDTGQGIKKEDLTRIADPFFTTKAPGDGTGLGLSITYNILQDHNGSLNFESELNKGTTVRVALPILSQIV